MRCYHSTKPNRVASILREGLLPNSPSEWFSEPVPYVMLSEQPWPDLNGEKTVVLEITDPRIQEEYFDEPEGLRWPYRIAPEHIRPLTQRHKN